jgi:hypothetical protein
VSASADTGVSTARTTSITPRAAEPAKAAPPATPLPHLQALLVPHTGKASALIDGQVLRVGEAVREWTVQSIRGDGVLLARAAAVAAPAGSGKPAKPAFAPVPTLWLSLLPPLASNVPSRP